MLPVRHRVLGVLLLLLGAPLGSPLVSQQVAPDPATQLSDLRARADGGDAEAMFLLGLLLADGVVAPKDLPEAVRWLTRASDAGNVSATVELGFLFDDDASGVSDEARSAALYRRAAEAGSDEAMFRMGVAHTFGRGVSVDAGEAQNWYAKAATAGHQEAQLTLGVLLLTAPGSRRNDFAASRWLYRAAHGADPSIAEKARTLQLQIDKRVLFSGPFTERDIIGLATVALGVAAIAAAIGPLFGNQVVSGSRPVGIIDPGPMPGAPAARRGRSCYQVPVSGGAWIPQGSRAFTYSTGTVTRCHSY